MGLATLAMLRKYFFFQMKFILSFLTLAVLAGLNNSASVQYSSRANLVAGSVGPGDSLLQRYIQNKYSALCSVETTWFRFPLVAQLSINLFISGS